MGQWARRTTAETAKPSSSQGNKAQQDETLIGPLGTSGANGCFHAAGAAAGQPHVNTIHRGPETPLKLATHQV